METMHYEVLSSNQSLSFLSTLDKHIERQADNFESEHAILLKKRRENLKRSFSVGGAGLIHFKNIINEVSMSIYTLPQVECLAKRAKGVRGNHLYAVRDVKFSRLTKDDIVRIGRSSKALLPEFESKIQRKRAFCLLMNSLLYDLKTAFRKKENELGWKLRPYERGIMNQCIDDVLLNAEGYSYRINEMMAFGYYPESPSCEIAAAC